MVATQAQVDASRAGTTSQGRNQQQAYPDSYYISLGLTPPSQGGSTLPPLQQVELNKKGGNPTGASQPATSQPSNPPPNPSGDFADQHPIANLDQLFANRFGRPPTPGEIGFIHGYQARISTDSPDKVLAAVGNVFSALDSEINKNARALGKTLTPQQISTIRDNVFDLGDPSIISLDPTDGAAITNAVNQVRPLIQSSVITGSYVNPESAVPDATKTDVGNLFQTLFNRTPTADETDYFGKQLAQGNTSLYEIRQSLMTHPEYLQIQAKQQQDQQAQQADQARGALGSQLLQSENEAFAKAQPDIIASYMRAGRLGSSGLDSALAKARADLAAKRQDVLANTAYQQSVAQSGYNQQNFVNNQNQGFQQYARDSAPSYNAQAYQAQVPYQALSDVGSRANELQDYYTQQNDYFRALQSQREQQSQSDRYGLYGALAGAAINGAAQGYARKAG